MRKLQKDTETVEKKTTRKTTRKTTKAVEKVKVKELEGTGADVAYLLGLSTANIVSLEQTGTIHKQENGLYNFVETVSSYCRSMRERKTGSGKTNLELENLALKNEKLKEGLRSWRVQRDREVGMAILEAQRNAMMKLRDECKLVPPLVSAIDEFINVIDSIDLDQISYTVEGENEEEDE